jgi:hypothetical protein
MVASWSLMTESKTGFRCSATLVITNRMAPPTQNVIDIRAISTLKPARNLIGFDTKIFLIYMQTAVHVPNKHLL